MFGICVNAEWIGMCTGDHGARQCDRSGQRSREWHCCSPLGLKPVLLHKGAYRIRIVCGVVTLLHTTALPAKRN